MSEARTEKANHFGVGAMAIAAIALLIAVIHLSAGPFKPQEPVSKTIAETAVAIKEAAKRAVTGEDLPAAEPAASRWDIDRVLDILVLVLAGIAMALAIFALLRKEPQTPAYVGFSLGVGVVLMAYLQWLALLICGAIILVAILNNLSDILPS